MRNRRALTGALALLLLSLAAAPASDSAPTIDALLGSERVRIPLSALAERVPLAADQPFRVVELGRDASTSHHLAAIRGAEKPHRHDRHDQLVVIARGYGTLRIGDRTLPVGEGSIVYVPRGNVHAFTNESDAPAVSYLIYTPPYDGVDRVETEVKP
jgi:mannose-6-phosphate isomerase-like protein (cupin superfamily)